VRCPAGSQEEQIDPTSERWLRSQHPEMDWSDPEGVLETLEILSAPEAMAELAEAESDIASDNLVPLDRYAPPS